jgi:uncharacterized protein YbjT (DUF2867 family)
MQTILVTGATGRVGGETVRLLRERGLPVRALVRDVERAAGLAALGAQLVQGDQSRPETLGPALAGVEAVLVSSSNDTGQLERERNVVEAAVAAGTRRIVKVSAICAAADAPASILRTHAAVEAVAAASGLEWTSLRPITFMQNFLLYAQMIRATGTFYGAMDDAAVALVDTRDVAAVAACCLADDGHAGRVYEVTGGEALSYPEAAARLGEALGKRVSYVDLPADVARQGMVDAGVPGWLADDLTALGELFKGPVGSTVTSTVRDVTGADPIAFDAFARDHVAFFTG